MSAVINFGLSGLLVYMGNREAWIREGTLITGYTAEDEDLLPVETKSQANPGTKGN